MRHQLDRSDIRDAYLTFLTSIGVQCEGDSPPAINLSLVGRASPFRCSDSEVRRIVSQHQEVEYVGLDFKIGCNIASLDM